MSYFLNNMTSTVVRNSPNNNIAQIEKQVHHMIIGIGYGYDVDKLPILKYLCIIHNNCCPLQYVH